MKRKFEILTTLLVSILGIPFVLNLLFKLSGPSWIVAEWSAGDALAYYGEAFTGLITIIGLIYTFRDNRKGIEEQERLDKLPIIALIALKVDYKLPLFVSDEEEDAFNNTSLDLKHGKHYYSETRITDLYYVIQNGIPVAYNKLSDEQIKAAKNHGIVQQQVNDRQYIGFDKMLIYLPMVVENIGNGPAIDLRVGFYRKDVDNPRYIPAFPFSTKDCFYFVIYAENPDDKNYGDYVIDFCYKDVFDNAYQQKYDFSIGSNKDTGLYSQMTCATKQERIKDYFKE